MTTKKKQSAKKSSDIPLDNIPERRTHRSYSNDFKLKAAQRVVAGESAVAVGEALGVADSLISKWAQRVRNGLPITANGGDRKTLNFKGEGDTAAAMLQQSLRRSQVARDERLEAAACIVEIDMGGKDGAALAKTIRSQKRSL